MKTLIDAVNEFECDMGCYNYIFGGTNKNKLNRGVSQLTLSTINNDSWWELCGRHEFLATVAECETNFGKCKQSYSDYKFDYHLSPEPTPAYTQAMADNGVLPSVGIECLIDGTGVVYIVVLPADNEGDLILTPKNEGGNYWQRSNVKYIKPLTPPITLIDGKAYQFELCFGDYRVGYYCSVRNSFFDGLLKSHKICGKAEATNIQPLTVEVK